MKITKIQKELTAYGVLGGMLYGIGTKQNTSMIALYGAVLGAVGFYIGKYFKN
jgi:hypothetical protein